MEVKKAAMAGTLESSDAQVTVEPGEGKIELTIESSVIHQYGRQIRKVTLETLDRLGVDAVKKLSADVGIPSVLEAIKEEDLPFLAESAHADACAPGNPKDASVEDLKDLFRKIMA